MKPKTKQIIETLITDGSIFNFKSLNEIAISLNISRERVRQILNELNFLHFSREEKKKRNAEDPQVLLFFIDYGMRNNKTFNDIANDLQVTYNTLFYATVRGKISKNLKEKVLKTYANTLTAEEKTQLL
jgi:DNA-binding Lrp family transcriptional regulator